MVRTQLILLLSLLISSSSLMGTVRDSFPFFEGKVRVPVGNHGSTSVEVLDQRFLKTTDGYGPHNEEIVLDLETGRIELITLDYTPSESKKTSSFLPAEQGGAYLPYRKQLDAMVSDLTWINQNLYYLSEELQKSRKPEMASVLSYLKDRLASADANAPESVALNTLPRDLRRSVEPDFIIEHVINVEYLAREKRDLLLEVYDSKWGYLKGTRVQVEAGHQTVGVKISIPENAPLDQAGIITARLVPVQGEAEAMLAEAKVTASFKKTRLITSTSASYIGFNSPRLAFYSNFYCPDNCDIRVDIFSAKGQWLTSAVVPANAPYAKNAEQFTSVYVDAPAAVLPAGQVYTYYVKILPQGANWDQFYDEMRGTFSIND